MYIITKTETLRDKLQAEKGYKKTLPNYLRFMNMKTK